MKLSELINRLQIALTQAGDIDLTDVKKATGVVSLILKKPRLDGVKYPGDLIIIQVIDKETQP